MVSYNVFFRPREPPRGTPESDELLRVRGNRNLNRRLGLAQETGDWVGAIKAISGAQRGNAALRVNGWHYGLAVHAFLNERTGPRERNFLADVHEAVILGDIPLNAPLYQALLYAYSKTGNSCDAMKIIELARAKRINQQMGRKGGSILLALAKGLNREGLWANALDVVNGLSGTLSPEEELFLRQVRSESHAIYGNWTPALRCISAIQENATEACRKGSDTLDQLNDLHLCVAHATAASAQWDISLRFLCAYAAEAGKQADVVQIGLIAARNLQSLRKLGHWEQVLALTRFLRNKAILPDVSQANMEAMHAMTLDVLTTSGQWEHALRYYMQDCAECDFETNVLRMSVSKMMIAAGRPQAARVILEAKGSDLGSRRARQGECIESHAVAYHKSSPGFALLNDCEVTDDACRSYPTFRVTSPILTRQGRHSKRVSDPEFPPDTPLSYRWTPKAAFNRAHLTQANGYFTNFTKEQFAETAPPPPTKFYDKATGWAHWNHTGLPVRKPKPLKTAYNFSHTETFPKIAPYKRAWKKYSLMRNLFRR